MLILRFAETVLIDLTVTYITEIDSDLHNQEMIVSRQDAKAQRKIPKNYLADE